MKNLLNLIYNKMNKEQVTQNLKSYISLQLDNMSKSSPVIGIVKPIFTRAIDKKLRGIDKFLDLLTDDNGDIDIDSIATEMVNNIINANPFVLNLPILGNINIGNGEIKMMIPATSKEIVFNSNDLQTFKETLTSKIQ